MRYFIGPLAIFTLRLSCTAATSDDAGLNLAGPLPYGWETLSQEGREIEANISVDLGYMYESVTVSERRDIYLSGRTGGDVNEGRKTIHSIITEITPESRYEIKATLRNLYVNCFDKLQSFEGGKSGNFDGRPVQLYADSIINDIFEVEDQSVSRRGLEKEGILIFSAWMRVYHHLHAFKQKCFTAEGEDHYYHNYFDIESDQAAVFWIGRLQVYGDNTSGMMLYNLAERAAINFNQNNEEADVNKNFISILKEMRSSHQDCTELGNGYDKLYVLLEKMVGVMYTPLIQNLIHYIATDANPALIELYLLALLPQVKSCDPHYFKILYSRIEFLVSSDYSVDQIVDVIGELQSMYNCFSVTCDDIGFHATGIGCVDEDHYPQIPFTDDIASSDVRKFLYADRDIVQINLLLHEKNIESAKELYVKGKNMKTGNQSDSNGGSYFHSLKEMALYTDLKDDLVRENINHRLYKMFENFYDSPEFAHIITEKAFEDDDLAFDAVPVLLDAMVIPQYAMRSFFAAVDVCNNGDKDKAMNFWDQGASVLVGSIELRNYIDGTSEGIGWWGMGRRNCADLDCSDTAETPYLKEMRKSIEQGRFYIDRLDCVLLKKNVQKMESIVITPIIQGVLFSSAKRQINGDETYHAVAYAYGEAILPLISVVKGNTEVELIRKSLEAKGPYNAEILWITILLSLEDLGIDCKDLGKDTLNILGGKSFCEYVSTVTEFPTSAPQPGQPLSPTTAPTFSPTMDIDSSEINSDLIDGYTFVNKTQAEEKAMIALDLRDILALRSHVESEQAQAKIIYNDGSLRMMAIGMEERMANDPYYNLYRNAFRTDPLFQAQGEQGDGYTLADIYAHKITTDAFEVDIELAYETLVCITIWMEIAHYLNAAVTSCGESIQEPIQAQMHIDSALAYYVGVKQTKGNSDGFLLYSLAQKSAVIFDTIDGDSGEALANMKMLQYFKEAKAKAGECNGSAGVTNELRILIGSMMSQLNIPLVQNFAHQLQIGSETEQGSAFSILYGLVVLPQVKTCNPAEYFYLTNEITANGLSLAHINDLISSFKNVYSCFGITCADVHGIDSSSCNTDTLQEVFAGFNPENDVLPVAVVDQDVLKISAYLDENAIIAAHACYEFGHLLHSADIGPIKSLKSIAQDPTWKQNKFFEMMKEYFGNENFADNIIEAELSSLANAAEAQEALDSNKMSVVMRSLQTLVLFPAGLGRMYKAQDICDDDKPLALKYWDEGAAYLIGSVEGPTWGGDEMYKGVGMYGLAKELCQYFKTCTASGNAETNDRLIGYFKSGEDLISGNSCNSLDDFLEKKVMSILMATLIQGAIHSTEGLFARGDATVFADALMPLIDVAGDTDAAAKANIIEDNLRSVNPGDSTEVIEAFSHLLSLTTVKCVDVGVFGDDELTVCKNTNDPDQSTDLSDGLYITKTSVKDRAMIGLDVRDMVEKLNGGLIGSAEDIYKEGSNSRITDKNGKLLGFRSIASLSKDAIDIMKDEPVYNLYQYTLDNVTNDSVNAYGHSAVQQLFDEADKAGIPPGSLPAEAAVALIIWGYITHELYEMILRCKKYFSTSDEDGVHSIDEAVAYWIGEGQETGSKTNGYLLYRLSEEGGELFDQKLLGGQSRTNKNILKLFKETSLQLAFDGTCGQNDSILRTLTMLTNKIIAQMTVPLIQHLIYNLKRNDGPRVALYAKAVVPLLAPCNPETFQFLNEKLLTRKYGINDIDDIIAYLQSSYSCLGLKCDDIGVLQDYSAPQCEDRKIIVPVGNYKPSTAVREYADIDHDIRFIEIMMMNENSAKAALDVYKFGKHSIVMESNERFTLSLRDLVLSSRKIVPTENAVALQNTDDWVQSLLKSPDLGASFDQNRALVASALKYEVLFFAALERLYDAADGCNSQDANRLYRARKDWDIAAAMIIGPSSETNPDGNLMYELAALHCDTFNVCNSKQESKINVELEELLFGGSYLLKGKGLSCAGVQSYANQISGLLKASLIQATLYYAIQNRKLQPNTDNPSLAVGHAISRAILPFVDEVDEAAAVIIKENLAFELTTKPVKDGPDAVFDAFRNTIVKMGVDCKWVGYLDSGKNVCPPEEEESSSSSRTRLHSFSYVVIVIFTIWWSF